MTAECAPWYNRRIYHKEGRIQRVHHEELVSLAGRCAAGLCGGDCESGAYAHAVGREGDERKLLARLSASADGARWLDMPQRRLGLRDNRCHEHARTPREMGRTDPSAVRAGSAAFRMRRTSPQARRIPLVHARDRAGPETGRAHAPPLRCGGLPRDRLSRTRRGRDSRGRAAAVHGRLDAVRQEGCEYADGAGVGSDGGFHPVARQTGVQDACVLLYALERHHADCLAGDGSRDVHRRL